LTASPSQSHATM